MESNWGIIGHEWAVQLLSKRITSGRTSHAYLFAGPQGVGKTLFATRLAQAINCTADDLPCGHCRACDLIGRGQHPDFHIVEPENDKIRIEAVRDLQNVLAMRPFEARYRVALISRFDRATESAMDALLKTLEEPPSMSKIVITADVGEILLPTIVSRCQVIPLRPVPPSQIEAALQQQLSLSPEQAEILARLSGGRPGWAINAAQNPDEYAAHSQSIDTLLGLLQSGRVARFNYAEELTRYEKIRDILEIWQSWWRDVMLVAEGSQVVPVYADRLADLEMVAERSGSEAARRALIAVRDAIQYLSRYANPRLTLEVMFLEMPYL